MLSKSHPWKAIRNARPLRFYSKAELIDPSSSCDARSHQGRAAASALHVPSVETLKPQQQEQQERHRQQSPLHFEDTPVEQQDTELKPMGDIAHLDHSLQMQSCSTHYKGPGSSPLGTNSLNGDSKR